MKSLFYVVTNWHLPAVSRRELPENLSGADATSKGIKLIHMKRLHENLIYYFDYFFLTLVRIVLRVAVIVYAGKLRILIADNCD